MDMFVSMSVFKRVAELGSFSATARETGLSQSTISKHVAALEQRLGTKLLNRSTRQLNLSEAGQEYYKHCIRILDDIAESESTIGRGQSQPAGTLRITTPVMFGRLFIAPMLWEFLETYPDISIELIMDDHYVDLIKEGMDLAIRAGRQLPDSTLVARKLGHCPEQVLVASPDYLAKHGEPKTPADLKHHNCLIHSLLTPSNEWEFSGPKGKERVRVHSRFISNNRDTTNTAALAGMGIALTFLWPNSAYIQQGQLKTVLADYVPNSMDIYAIYPERRFVPQKVRSLIEHLNNCFSSSKQFRTMVEDAIP